MSFQKSRTFNLSFIVTDKKCCEGKMIHTMTFDIGFLQLKHFLIVPDRNHWYSNPGVSGRNYCAIGWAFAVMTYPLSIPPSI